ncbi:MAG TPA: hypothetical protein VGC04_00915 [Cellulomonas sp.]
MSHDLERALDDLAGAAVRAAAGGTLGDVSAQATLRRLVTRVRRRRAARAGVAGVLALALAGATAGAVGLTAHHGPTPAGEPSPTWPAPLPGTLSTATGTSLCGATGQALAALDGSADLFDVRDLTPETVSGTDPFGLTVNLVNTGSEAVQVAASAGESVLLLRDDVVVAAGPVGPPQGQATIRPGAGLEWNGPALAFDCSRLDGVTRAGPGDYTLWFVADVTLSSPAARTVRVAGGPWPITLAADAQQPAPTDQPSASAP